MDFSTDSVPSSPLTEPSIDMSDLDVDNEPDFADSRASTPASTSSSLLLRPSAPRPHSLDPNFFGYSFKQGGYPYTIRERSAAKKGGKTSYIWEHESEAHSPKMLHLSWLCNHYWDKNRIYVTSVLNTIRLRQHLL